MLKSFDTRTDRISGDSLNQHSHHQNQIQQKRTYNTTKSTIDYASTKTTQCKIVELPRNKYVATIAVPCVGDTLFCLHGFFCYPIDLDPVASPPCPSIPYHASYRSIYFQIHIFHVQPFSSCVLAAVQRRCASAFSGKPRKDFECFGLRYTRTTCRRRCSKSSFCGGKGESSETQSLSCWWRNRSEGCDAR